MNRPTPAIVGQSAVRLPRVALILFCAYVLPGFLGREPGRTPTWARSGPWPRYAGGSGGTRRRLPVEDTGLLPYWLGALFIKAWFLPPVHARLPFGLLLALTLSCTCTRCTSWRAAAAPVAFARW